MRKTIGFLVIFAFVVSLALISNNVFARQKKNKGATKGKKVEEVTKKAAGAEKETKVVYTFKSDKDMAEFEKLYVSKQATFGRMGVLQAYFAMEQNNLTQIDKQMEEKFGFKMDPSKMYDLNRDKKELREVGPVPKATPTPAPAK